MQLFGVTFGLLFAALACAPSPLGDSQVHSDADVKGDSYDAYVERMETLEDEYPETFEVYRYGESINGRPLIMTVIGENPPALEGDGDEFQELIDQADTLEDLSQLREERRSNGKRPALFFSGATHGNEHLGVATELPGRILEAQDEEGFREYFAKGGIIVGVPIYNPDGYAYHQDVIDGERSRDGPDIGNSWGRMNANEKDLNRDFPGKASGPDHEPLQQPENRDFVGSIEQLMQSEGGFNLEFTLDYHCCLAPGTLLWPFAAPQGPDLPRIEAQNYDQFSEIMRSEIEGVRAGPTDRFINYDPKGTSGDYFYETFAAIAQVYEGTKAEPDRVDAHLESWRGFAQHVASKYDEPSGEGEDAQGINQDIGALVSPTNTLYFGAEAEVTALYYCPNSTSCNASDNDSVELSISEERGDRSLFTGESLELETGVFSVSGYVDGQKVSEKALRLESAETS